MQHEGARETFFTAISQFFSFLPSLHPSHPFAVLQDLQILADLITMVAELPCAMSILSLVRVNLFQRNSPHLRLPDAFGPMNI